jgi:hypothetical protein
LQPLSPTSQTHNQRLKGEQRVLFQDAQGAFFLMKPNVWKEGHSHIRAWDAEGFTTADTQGSKTKGRARNGSAFFVYFRNHQG